MTKVRYRSTSGMLALELFASRRRNAGATARPGEQLAEVFAVACLDYQTAVPGWDVLSRGQRASGKRYRTALSSNPTRSLP